MDLAANDLRLHRGRFMATVVGVGLLFTIVLAMNGLYRGNIQEGLALIRSVNPDLWVVERYRGGPFNEQSTMPEAYHYNVKAISGVERASPFIYYAVERQVKGRNRHFSIVGFDIFEGVGGPQKIYAGRNIARAHYEMVAHPKLGVKVGDVVTLGLHDYTVVGLTKEAVSTDGEALVWLSLPDAQEVLYQKDNEEIRAQRESLLRDLDKQTYLSQGQAEKLSASLPPDTHIINAVLVRLTPGADHAEAAGEIKNWLYLSAFTTGEEVQLMLQGRLSSMSKQLLLFRTLLLIISVVVLSLVVYTFTMEKIRSIAVMKLIGAPNGVVIRMVLEESLLLTIAAFLLGVLIIQNTYQLFPRTILRVPADDIVTFLIAVAGGIFASILGLWEALKTEPALALGT